MGRAGAPDLPRALAIPQTSECATNSCDDADYSNRDLTDQYYTKGSVKRANFRNSNLAGVTLFGADLTEADFTGADLTNANIGQCNLTKTIFKDANLSGAIVSGANMDDVGDIDGSDWTDVIVRKDVNDKLCAKKPTGLNPVTGAPTAMTLFCDKLRSGANYRKRKGGGIRKSASYRSYRRSRVMCVATRFASAPRVSLPYSTRVI